MLMKEISHIPIPTQSILELVLPLSSYIVSCKAYDFDA